MAIRLFLSALLVGSALVGCKKSAPDPEPRPAPAPPSSVDAPPPPPPAGEPAAGLETPWGEKVPAEHEHPAGVKITAFDIGGQIYDLSIRDLPAVNPAGDIAYPSSISIGDLDWSNLSLVIAGPGGAIKKEVVIFDARKDAGERDEPIPLTEVQERASRANALVAGPGWRPMIGLESTGPLAGGAEQKLASADRSVAAVYREPALTIRTRDTTAVVDASAWSKPCPGRVLLSGVWFDPPTGSVVARVGYESGDDCAADPIFAVSRATR